VSLHFLALFFGTFVLEDAALVGALALLAQNKIGLNEAFWACFLGISVGDSLVYALGYVASLIKLTDETGRLYRFVSWIKSFKIEKTLSYMIVASRAIPGARLPTYLLAGYIRYSFLKFTVLTLISVFAWVLFAFTLGHSVQGLVADHWVYSTVLCVALLFFCRSLLPLLMNSWQRKALKYAWKRWLPFEFWPAWLFYIPIVPQYIYLSIKYRSFFLPFYANPHIPHSGFVGESKWDFYRYLTEDSSSLKTRIIQFSPQRETEIRDLLKTGHFKFPFILKPDTGQRGFAVRIINSDTELNNYLAEAQFDILIQEYCAENFEAGVFYYRLPSEPKGHLFSITDKKFPFVIGDGHSKLGHLILSDRRAQTIAPTYFARFEGQLDSVPVMNEKIYLSTCGNHCQGAIFLNGKELSTPELLSSFELIAQRIPDFYFGRFDIRYESVEKLKQGEGFKIVEVNGAGSEATHIWDARTSLLEAYSVLFQQWALIFKIGYEAKQKKLVRYPFSISRLLKDLSYMTKRNKNLSTSS
jgi:membrane protein DedA with SNARE-associated domain